MDYYYTRNSSQWPVKNNSSKSKKESESREGGTIRGNENEFIDQSFTSIRIETLNYGDTVKGIKVSQIKPNNQSTHH